MSVSTLHYVIGRKYLTVGIICKYFIKHVYEFPLRVPRAPTSGTRFTNDNINTLRKEIQFSFEKNFRGRGEGGSWGGGGHWAP